MTWVALYLAVAGAVVLDHCLEARRAMREAGRVGLPKAVSR